jgi:hypothetical protein
MCSSDTIAYADPERRLRWLLRRLPGRSAPAQKARLALGPHSSGHSADHRQMPRHPSELVRRGTPGTTG